MAISVVKTSLFELRESRKAIVREAAVRLAMNDKYSEEGVEELVRDGAIGKAIIAWRGIVRDNGGNVDEVAGKVFTPQQRESLRQAADAVYLKGNKEQAPKIGDHEAVKVVERLLFQTAVKCRNTANPHLGEKDPHAAHRVVESIKEGLPQLKSPKLAATSETIGWFHELLAKLGG